MSFTPKVKKVLTLPLIKLAKGVPVYLQITEAFFVGKKIDDKKEPATIANVIDLATGECAQIIVPSVLKSTIQESYPNDSYVGLGFSIEKTSAAGDGDKAYAKFSVSEIEVPADADKTASKGKK